MGTKKPRRSRRGFSCEGDGLAWQDSVALGFLEEADEEENPDNDTADEADGGDLEDTCGQRSGVGLVGGDDEVVDRCEEGQNQRAEPECLIENMVQGGGAVDGFLPVSLVRDAQAGFGKPTDAVAQADDEGRHAEAETDETKDVGVAGHPAVGLSGGIEVCGDLGRQVAGGQPDVRDEKRQRTKPDEERETGGLHGESGE